MPHRCATVEGQKWKRKCDVCEERNISIPIMDSSLRAFSSQLHCRIDIWPSQFHQVSWLQACYEITSIIPKSYKSSCGFPAIFASPKSRLLLDFMHLSASPWGSLYRDQAWQQEKSWIAPRQDQRAKIRDPLIRRRIFVPKSTFRSSNLIQKALFLTPHPLVSTIYNAFGHLHQKRWTLRIYRPQIQLSYQRICPLSHDSDRDSTEWWRASELNSISSIWFLFSWSEVWNHFNFYRISIHSYSCPETDGLLSNHMKVKYSESTQKTGQDGKMGWSPACSCLQCSREFSQCWSEMLVLILIGHSSWLSIQPIKILGIVLSER
jgi:hypothetical protein